MPNVRGVDRSIGAEAALVLLGFTLLAVAATFPLIRVIATHLPGDLGDPVMNTWLLAGTRRVSATGSPAGVLQTRPPPRRLLTHLAIALVVIAATLAPIISAYYRVRREYGLRRTTAEITELSADVRDYVSPSPRVWIWRRVASDRNEHNLFPGALVLVLSAVAVAVRPREPAVRVYGSIAAIAFVFSLGPQPAAWGQHLPFAGPYAWLLRVTPGLDGLRVVARLDFISILGLAVVAAFGAAWLLERVGRRRRSR